MFSTLDKHILRPYCMLVTMWLILPNSNSIIIVLIPLLLFLPMILSCFYICTENKKLNIVSIVLQVVIRGIITTLLILKANSIISCRYTYEVDRNSTPIPSIILIMMLIYDSTYLCFELLICKTQIV